MTQNSTWLSLLKHKPQNNLKTNKPSVPILPTGHKLKKPIAITLASSGWTQVKPLKPKTTLTKLSLNVDSLKNIKPFYQNLQAIAFTTYNKEKTHD